MSILGNFLKEKTGHSWKGAVLERCFLDLTDGRRQYMALGNGNSVGLSISSCFNELSLPSYARHATFNVCSQDCGELAQLSLRCLRAVVHLHRWMVVVSSSERRPCFESRAKVGDLFRAGGYD